MHFLEHFQSKNLRYDLINKFFYNNIKKLPKIKKIILNFGCKASHIKTLSASLLALELITNNKGSLTRTKKANILLKIRKGNPVGCKVTLRKKHMNVFIEKMLIEVFPNIKNFDGLKLNRKIKKQVFSYELHDTLNFNELKDHYYIFNNLPKLNITFVTSASERQELIFLLKSIQLPLTKV